VKGSMVDMSTEKVTMVSVEQTAPLPRKLLEERTLERCLIPMPGVLLCLENRGQTEGRVRGSIIL